ESGVDRLERQTRVLAGNALGQSWWFVPAAQAGDLETIRHPRLAECQEENPRTGGSRRGSFADGNDNLESTEKGARRRDCHYQRKVAMRWLRSKSSKPCRRRLGVEALESREVLSAAGPACVQTLYIDVLGRQIDGSGQQMFGQALAAGVTRQQVAATLLSSQEYHQMEVSQLFARYLKRSADPSGLTTFTAALDRGVSVNQVISSLTSSGEY